MSMIRHIKRNMFKKLQGSNRIRRRWRKAQIQKFGLKKWCQIYNRSNVNNKAYAVTPEDALNI